MKAVIKTRPGPGNIELGDVPVPKIGDNEVLIKVIGCGICTSDVYIWRWDEAARYLCFPPVILGAENYGEVAEVGKRVKGWQLGDRVCAEVFSMVCGKCLWCRTGQPQMCPEGKIIGRGVDGAFAEYFKTGAEWLHKIPDNVSNDEAALTEMAAVVSQCLVEKKVIAPGDFVVVLGPGPIGQLCSQIAKAMGAEKVVITGTTKDEGRLKIAKELRADLAINVEEEDPLETVKGLTGGREADVVVEASGFVQETAEQALNLVRKGGKIAQIGHGKRKPISVTWDRIQEKSLTIYGSHAHAYNAWEQALSMMSTKKIKAAPLLTHKFPLEEWKKGFEMVERREGIKIALTPT